MKRPRGTPEAPTVLLHVSDIHRTPDEKATNAELLLSLTADLDRHRGEGIPAPHLLVVSGDLVQRGDDGEYQEAREFLHGILEHLELTADRLVVVPGNHDVHWSTCRESLRPVEASDIAVPPELVREMSDVTLAPSSEAAYARRLDRFRTFYSETTGRTFPEERGRSYVVHDFYKLPVHLSIAELSSVDTNDPYNKVGRISPDAILAAKRERNADARFSIAVWHHDANWNLTTSSDFLQVESLQFVAQAGFDFGLCGHTHRPGRHDTVLHRDQSFPLVNAGTLCAGPRERAESIPRTFNVIEVHSDGRVRVHVRWKETLAAPWKDHAVFGEPGHRCAWYEFNIRPKTPGPTTADEGDVPPTPGGPETSARKNRELRTGPSSSPFREYDARAQTPAESVKQYVWLQTSSRTDTDQAQVIVGTRGSGKTSLLLTLTPLGRFHHSAHLRSAPLRRLAFVFPLRIHQISGLSGRGWIAADERKDLFRAILGTGMAYAFVDCVEQTIQLFGDEPGMPRLGEACDSVGRCWFSNERANWTVDSLRERINSLNQKAVSLHSDRDENRRREGVRELSEEGICGSGIQFIVRAAEDLATYTPLRDTHWIAAFDEAEFLNERQQSLVYGMLGQTTSRVGVKIATLPYAHSRAIQNLEHPLVPGDDYEEVAIALSYTRTSPAEEKQGSADDKDESEAQAFEVIAHQIWERRLAPHFDVVPALESVFPAVPYEEVVATVRGKPTTANQLQLELIGQLSPKRQKTASEKAGEQLGSQFLRKYQQPFRFRTARKDGRRLKKPVPLYWGLSDVVRACDGNCRAFLQILETCWRRHWATSGLRPLTALEQNDVLVAWAGTVRRKVRAFGERGQVLDRILQNLTDAFASKLHRGYLTYESLRWSPSQKLTDEELEAILIGIAYGLLSPRLETADEGQVAYPAGDEIAVRLGFPIAVSSSLPLRSGAELSVNVNRMIQLGFPGWE